MSTATIAAFIDKYHPQKDGKCKVSIRVTYDRKKRYYPTNLSLKPGDFERIIIAKRRNEADRKIFNELHAFEDKAMKAVSQLPVFTFSKFEDIYLQNREATDSIAYGFDKYIKELREEKRIGTAVSYQVAKNSLESFIKGVRFADVNKELLVKYENWMIEKGKSKTTVGIYLRSLRAIFNRANIDRSLYPFGEGKDKYSIPIGRNIKKALTLEEIAAIFDFKTQPDTNEEMAKDYWIFIYLCNGLNVKDLCLLKQKNIKGEIIEYERAKTMRSKKTAEVIRISLKPEAKRIIGKWGVSSSNPESYIFPHLQKGMTPERERQVYQQLTKTINKYMKRIAREGLKINKDVTTYFARHSFATVLRNAGVSMEFISEALGHGDLKTTKSYLAGFEEDVIHEKTNALLLFNK